MTLRSLASMLHVLGVRAKISLEPADAPYTAGVRWDSLSTAPSRAPALLAGAPVNNVFNVVMGVPGTFLPDETPKGIARAFGQQLGMASPGFGQLAPDLQPMTGSQRSTGYSQGSAKGFLHLDPAAAHPVDVIDGDVFTELGLQTS